MLSLITGAITRIRRRRPSNSRPPSRRAVLLRVESMEVRLVPAGMVIAPSLPIPVVASAGAVVKVRDNQIEMPIFMFTGTDGSGLNWGQQWDLSQTHLPGPHTPPPPGPDSPPPPAGAVVKVRPLVVGSEAGDRAVPTAALADGTGVLVPSPIPPSPWIAPSV